MKYKTMLKHAVLTSSMLVLAACETVQTTQGGVVGVNREQKMAVSADALEQAAREQYAQLIAAEGRKGTLNTNPAQVARIKAIAARIVPQTTVFRQDARAWAWEVNVLTSPEAMPGACLAARWPSTAG